MVLSPHIESLVLRPESQSAGEARRFARLVCNAARLGADIREVAVLLTSETVTNAIVHGRSDIRLRISVDAACVRVEVGDDNSRRPVVRPPDNDALDGRGMALLDAVATRWGVAGDAVGKRVWFEVALLPTPGNATV